LQFCNPVFSLQAARVGVDPRFRRTRRRFALYLPIKTTAFLAVHVNVGQARSSLARDEKATKQAAPERG
jgi:hypothetical protein